MDIRSVVELNVNPNIPTLAPGDTVRVSAKVREGNRERIQVFEGLIIRIRRGGASSNFTVRRIASGVGVERTFFLQSPLIDKVEVVRHGRVRRAKLYYMRELTGKAARLKERRPTQRAMAGISPQEAAAGTGPKAFPAAAAAGVAAATAAAVAVAEDEAELAEATAAEEAEAAEAEETSTTAEAEETTAEKE